MRRIALFSDIHGNLAALDAVLADMAVAGVEECYCLGDLVGYGPDPAGVIARMCGVGIPTIRGNYDDGIGKRKGGCGCFYPTLEAKEDGAVSYTFTDRALTPDDHAWLAALPDDIRFEEEGLRFLLAHGSPRKINEYLLPDRPDAQLARMADESEADVICVGHVHMPYHRVLGGSDGRRIHYVSDGSVGKPKDGDPRAGWTELVVGAAVEVRAAAASDPAAGVAGLHGMWVGSVVHRVAYDARAVAAAMIERGLPARLAEELENAGSLPVS
jgi:predicted phosphodiesterase